MKDMTTTDCESMPAEEQPAVSAAEEVDEDDTSKEITLVAELKEAVLTSTNGFKQDIVNGKELKENGTNHSETKKNDAQNEAISDVDADTKICNGSAAANKGPTLEASDNEVKSNGEKLCGDDTKSDKDASPGQPQSPTLLPEDSNENVASEVGSSAIDDAEPEGQNAVSDNEEPTNQESKEDLSNNHSSDPQPEAKTSEDESVNDKEEHDSGEPEMQENVLELCTDDQKPILELGEKEDAAEDKTKEDATEYIETEDEEAEKETSKEDKQGSSSQAESDSEIQMDDPIGCDEREDENCAIVSEESSDVNQYITGLKNLVEYESDSDAVLDENKDETPVSASDDHKEPEDNNSEDSKDSAEKTNLVNSSLDNDEGQKSPLLDESMENEDGDQTNEKPNKPEEKTHEKPDEEVSEEELDIDKSLEASLDTLEKSFQDDDQDDDVATRESSEVAAEIESEKEKDFTDNSVDNILDTGNNSDADGDADADDEEDSKMSTENSEAEEPNAEEALASLAQIEKNTKRILDDDWNEDSDSSKKRTTDNATGEPSVKKPKLDGDASDKVVALKKKIKKGLGKLKRSEIEEMVATKCLELMTNKSELGKLRQQADGYEETVERWKRRAGALSKQCTDLSTVMRKYITDSKTKGRDKVVPVRITRSVGLQVNLSCSSVLRRTHQLLAGSYI